AGGRPARRVVRRARRHVPAGYLRRSTGSGATFDRHAPVREVIEELLRGDRRGQTRKIGAAASFWRAKGWPLSGLDDRAASVRTGAAFGGHGRREGCRGAGGDEEPRRGG